MNPNRTPEALRLADIYEALAESEGGKHLLNWIAENVKSKQEGAGSLEPTQAWGELKIANGLQQVADYISLMQSLGGKRTLKQ